MKPLPDQKDILTENAQLDLRARSLRAEIFAKTADPISAPVTPQNDILETNSILKAHVIVLESRLGNIGTAKPTNAPGKKLTLTERVLHARGVHRIEDLKPHVDPLD